MLLQSTGKTAHITFSTPPTQSYEESKTESTQKTSQSTRPSSLAIQHQQRKDRNHFPSSRPPHPNKNVPDQNRSDTRRIYPRRTPRLTTTPLECLSPPLRTCTAAQTAMESRVDLIPTLAKIRAHRLTLPVQRVS